MTIKECVKKYTVYLKNITHIPAKEVEILIMHLLDKNVIWLHLNYDKAFTKELELEKLVKKRATNFPLEYIIKKASFYGEQFFTDVDVLIPRPETELLVENAFEILKEVKNQEKSIKILEIGVILLEIHRVNYFLHPVIKTGNIPITYDGYFYILLEFIDSCEISFSSKRLFIGATVYGYEVGSCIFQSLYKVDEEIIILPAESRFYRNRYLYCIRHFFNDFKCGIAIDHK